MYVFSLFIKYISSKNNNSLLFRWRNLHGTNVCAFLSSKIAQLILIKNHGPNYTHNFHTIKPLIESLIFSFPIHINSIRDVDNCYDIDTPNNFILNNKLIHPMDINAVYKSTQIYSDKTTMSLNSIIQKLDGIGILTCPPYIFLVGNYSDKPFIIDSYAIPKTLGGNNNGTIIIFLDTDNAIMWLIQRLYMSGITSSCLNMKQV